MSETRQAFPVSYAQQRLWVLEQLTPGAAHYHLAGAVRLSRPIDLEALGRSVTEIVRRHESLRTGFQAVAGEPVQVVAAHADIDLTVMDAPDGDPSSPQIKRLINDEIRQPFDLSRPPLLRVKALRAGDDWLLVITMHHIISDGWSVGVFFRELTTLYRAYVRGEPSPFPDLPVQYVDYTVWQREWLASGALANQMQFWTQHLRGLPLLDLPTDHPRPAEALLHGARLPLSVPAETAARLRSLCAEEGVTPFMALLAAFEVLLHRYSGQDEIVVGMPVAGRNRPELEGLIGFFVNTLVLRLDLSGNPTLRQVLHRVRKVALDAFEHPDVPFEKIVEQLKPERDPSRNPLFQVTFQLLQSAQAPGASSGASFTSHAFDVDCGTSGFDLSVDMWEEGPVFGGRVEYSTELFERSSVERIATHFGVVLDRLSTAPDLRLSEFHLLSAEESERLLAPVDAAAPALPCVQDMIREHGRPPDALALTDGLQRLTYADLDARVAGTSRRLRAAGCGPGTVAGLYLPRGTALVVAMLAVLETGAAYVALDPTYPAGRSAAMLADARAALVVTTAELAESTPPGSGVVVVVDMAGGAASGREPARAASHDVAYVVYTSGSTGRPNGCLIPHRALANHCAAIAGHYDLSPADRVLQFASPSFDVVAEEIFPALASGAAVCVFPAGSALTFLEFADFLLDHQITVANLPADFWHGWVSFLDESRTPVPSCLRLLIVGSATVSAQQMTRWQRVAPPHVRVVNAYGVSEAAITSTIFEVPAGADFRDSVSVPIGRPISNVQVYVLDRYGQPVPPGIPGELCIAGPGLALGYLNRPELTAERFIEHSLAGAGRVRLYRTGDRARLRADGNLECLGRLDNQISVRGFRVEPEEVEAVLASHPAVDRLAVIGAHDERGETRLVAYVVSKSAVGVSADQLRSFAAGRLPSYMVPSVFVAVDTLPLTSNGKIDRLALRSRPLPVRPRDIDGAPPTTFAEQVLVGIWMETLGIPRVGIHDNFFELGGDSILSIRIMSRANQAGLRLNPIQIFQHQTIAELASVAGTAAPAGRGHVLHAHPFTLTPVQQWFFDQELPNLHHYNQAAKLELSGAIDAAALERAFGELMVHHDALRLRFNRDGGAWRQRYEVAAGEVPFVFEDVGSLPAADAAARIAVVCTKAQEVLNLSDGPLLRAVLFGLPGDGCRLLIVIHHLCVDGVSWRVLLDDLRTAYGQARSGVPVLLPLKTASLQEWGVRLQQAADSPTVRAELDGYLAMPFDRIGPLPTDYADGKNTVASESAVSIDLSSECTGRLLRYAPAAYRADVNDVLLAALALALSEWSGNPVQLIDVEGHGREPLFADLDVSRTVGWFTSICPRVLDVSAAVEPLEALRAVKEQLRAFSHRGIGYGLLRYLCPDQRVRDALAALPRAEISFNYMGQFERTAYGSPGFTPDAGGCGPLRDRTQPRGYLLELNGHIADGKLSFEWTFSRDVHARATVQAVADSFCSKLESLLHGAEHAPSSAYTPSDFPLANLNQRQLEKLMRRVAKVGTP